MIGSIIGLILLCVFLGFVWWAAQKLLALVPLAEPFATMVNILLVGLVVVVVIWAIVLLFSFAGIHVNTLGIVR